MSKINKTRSDYKIEEEKYILEVTASSPECRENPHDLDIKLLLNEPDFDEIFLIDITKLDHKNKEFFQNEKLLKDHLKNEIQKHIDGLVNIRNWVDELDFSIYYGENKK